jgi:hypothetical protein
LEAVGFLVIARPNSRGNQAVRDEIRSILEARIAEEHAAKATDATDSHELPSSSFRASYDHSQKAKGRIKFVTNAYEICCEIHKTA